jgi:DHA2 family multidrug resistance protein
MSEGDGTPHKIIPVAGDRIPWLGLLAVLLGAFISTLNGRLSALGLADIRGAVHAGFDEGAWITTAQTVGQMLVVPVAVWMGKTYGPRRVLLKAACAFAMISAITPLSPDISTLLVFQFLGGLASGFFIPLTLSFILRNIPPKLWAYGIAIYALNLELSLNISASLEGWYVDNLSWMWIFWQNVPLATGMVLCLHFGAPRDEMNPDHLPSDWFGLISGGLGLAMIYSALDQGNRLDWLNSGVVWGLLMAGGVVVAGFLIHETRIARPLLDLKVILTIPLLCILALTVFLRLTILSTAYLIPEYLSAVRDFRALEVGQALIWIAVPQLILCPLAGFILRRVDPRLLSATGFICISAACFAVAHGLTPLWGSDQFLPTELLQAVGQSFAVSGITFSAVLHLRMEDALTFGAANQTARLMGGEIGQAFVVTLVRIRSQTASNLIGLHVQAGAWPVVHRLQTYAAIAARAEDPWRSTARATSILDSVVRNAATTQGVIDAFVALSGLTAVALILLASQKVAPQTLASRQSVLTHRETPQS